MLCSVGTSTEASAPAVLSLHYTSTSRLLPSSFLGARSRAQPQTQTKKVKLCSYDRDIVCLPFCYSSKHGKYAIPRSETRATLASSGLIGKVRLSSDMSQDQILTEIRSVFSAEMNENQNFPISFLQRSGQGSNSLTVPSISNSYQWSAKEVVRMAGQGCIYIKAEARLNCEMVGGIN